MLGADIPIQKLRRYLQYYSTKLILKADPLKYILSWLTVNGRLTKQTVLLQ